MTELLYADVHKACYHYDKQESPTIRTVVFEKDREIQINFNTIIMVLEGKGSLSYGKNVNRPMKKEEILLLPIYTQVKFYVEEKLTILIFRLHPSFHFCDHFSLEALYMGAVKKKKEIFNPLKMNDRVKSYVNSLLLYLDDGLKCRYFLELKIKELFYVLRAYNSEKDLAAFFQPILSEDMEFHNFIMNNYQTTKTVKEFAQKANYSITGFEKRFKKVFGTTAHEWMKDQLASSLYHEINCSRKTFMEISDTYGFSSSAHFSNFCKSVFGMSPSAIRKGGTRNKENEFDVCKIM